MQSKQEIIIGHFRDGCSISSISKKVGVCRQTVRKYIQAYKEEKAKSEGSSVALNKSLVKDIVEQPTYDSSNRKKRKLTEEIILAVKECLEENRKKKSRGQHKQLLNKGDILEHVHSLGFDIGYTSICELVNKLEHKHSESYIRQHYQPGNVCEFDWGIAKVSIGGKLRSFHQALFTSAYSNYRYSILFCKENTQSFQEAHARFFEHIGGAYRTLVYDNMRIAVGNFVGRCEKEATKGLLQLSIYYNFAYRFCNVRAGNEKGHVEKSVGYVRQKAFSKKDSFESLEQANAYLLTVCERLNNKPQTANKNRTADELLKEEKEYLLPAPAVPFESSRVSELRVDKYSTITVDRCHYSVPEEYTGKFITARIYSDEIICFSDNKRICTHKKSIGTDEWIIDIDHFLKTLERKPGAIANSVALLRMRQEYQLLFRKHFTANPKDFINLLAYQKEHQISLSEILAVVSRLEQVCPKDISTDKLKTIIQRKDDIVLSQSNNQDYDRACHQLCELSRLIPKQDQLTEQRRVL